MKRLIAVLNVVGFIATVVINTLASTLPLNGKDTGELSDQYPNLFVPSGLTFSIWGVIYILLGIYVVYQLVLAIGKKVDDSGQAERIGLLFLLSSVANCGWIFAWHYEVVWLSIILMLLLFVSLLGIYLRLSIGKGNATQKQKYLIHLAFSVYLGWITVATIANVTALLVDAGWNGFGISEQFWATLVIAVATLIAIAMTFRRNDIYFALVADWAAIGILIKRTGETATSDTAVVISAGAAIGLISLGIIAQIIRRKAY